MNTSSLMRLFFVVAVLFFSVSSSQACTRVFWNTNRQAMVVARTMDLFRSDEAKFMVYPVGIAREGLPGDKNGLRWTSKYGSVAIVCFGKATADGLNEKGLAVNLLYMGNSDYEARDGRPGIAYSLWAQYFLDNCRTVKEALDAMPTFQVVPVILKGKTWPLHLAIEDASGDSAVIEFIGGKAVIHHGRQFTVMTNEPSFDEQLANLKKYKLFGGTLAMPGDIDPIGRFVRTSSYLKTLPAPKDALEAAAGVYGVARTAAVPFGAEDTSGSKVEDAWPTLWFTIADLTNKVYAFQSTRSPHLYWVELGKLPLAAGNPVRSINAYDAALTGDISAKLAGK